MLCYVICVLDPKMVGTPAAGYALWVKMNTPEAAFGLYWFKIKNIKLKENKEIIFQLKILRTVDSGLDSSPTDKSDIHDDSMAKFINEWFNYDYKESFFKFLLNISSLITAKNIYESICFLSALLLALGMGMIKALHYIGDYSLKLTRELSILIHSSTPIILGVIDMLAKIVGGFYLLIAMVWNSSKTSPSSAGAMTFKRNLLSLPPTENYPRTSSSSASENSINPSLYYRKPLYRDFGSPNASSGSF